MHTKIDELITEEVRVAGFRSTQNFTNAPTYFTDGVIKQMDDLVMQAGKIAMDHILAYWDLRIGDIVVLATCEWNRAEGRYVPKEYDGGICRLEAFNFREFNAKVQREMKSGIFGSTTNMVMFEAIVKLDKFAADTKNARDVARIYMNTKNKDARGIIEANVPADKLRLYADASAAGLL